MSGRIGLPVKVEVDAAGRPVAFTWRGHIYTVEVIGHRRLSDRWWDRERQSDRRYYRVVTADFQLFELYQDTTGYDEQGPVGDRWHTGLGSGAKPSSRSPVPCVT